MTTELHGADRKRAAALFESLPAVHGSAMAGLSGEFGRLWVDDPDPVSVALLHLDFHFLVGDVTSPVAETMVQELPRRAAILAPPEWEPLLESVHGKALESYERVVFQSACWDRDRLGAFVAALPAGFELERVTEDDVEQFEAFDRSLVKNFRDLDHFLTAGVGFAAKHRRAIVAGCSSFTQAEGFVEIEIDTEREYRRRGLAQATGSALVLHCLDHGLVPCWDAANEGSARLGAKLGFTRPLRYSAWYLNRLPHRTRA